MLKFDSWPPEQGKVHFTEGALDTLLDGITNEYTVLFGVGRAVATLLHDNCVELPEATRIYADLTNELPVHGITDANNGVDDIMGYNPQQAFIKAGSSVLPEINGVTV